MVVLANPPTEQLSLVDAYKPNANASTGAVPVVDLSSPSAAADIVAACEEMGFFKVVNHGFPAELTAKLEAEAVEFFSLPEGEKDKGGPALPFGYGSKRIGYCGDVGWVEYLLFDITTNPIPSASLDFLEEPRASLFRSALNEYISAVKRLASELLELMAEGMEIQPRNAFSEIIMGEESDRMFRLNHYPAFSQLQQLDGSLTGFGEHTDPQIISILQSNNSNGLQIAMKDGTWVPVPPDQTSFFVNVGDILQVLTNGRFRSVRHRVETKGGSKPRLSMIYFGGPPATHSIGPLPQLLLQSGERSRYKEFTWADYKKAAYNSKLADNRLSPFENTSTAAVTTAH